MKSDSLTVRTLYYNHSIMNFFFRTQAENTFEELFNKVEESVDEVIDAMEDYDNDLDTIEEMLYNDSIEDLAEAFGLTLIENENEDENE